ncbi:MAG: DUF501 domain-containing protein [Acidimicrobiia bacterium]
MDDRSVVAVQLGREPRSIVDPAASCHLGLPTVIAVPPHLDDGTPFPTSFWLTCPLAVKRIGRVESSGGVAAAEVRIASDAGFASRHYAAMRRYETDREALIPPGSTGPRPSGGVGGAARGVKCLHAHYADHAAGNDNPVGEHTAADIEPLDCAVRCVAVVEGSIVRNPEWREPRP